MKTEATDRQADVLKFIIDYRKEFGYSPTFRDIAIGMKITVKGAYDHVELLQKKGFVICDKNRSRSLRVLKLPEGM